MGRLNKDELDLNTLLQLEGKLFNALSRKESGEMEALLRGLLTPVELEMLAKRVELLRLLNGGTTNKQLVDSLKLSSTTVSQTRSKLRYDRSLQKLAKELTPETA